jgi:hypothetical protein
MTIIMIVFVLLNDLYTKKNYWGTFICKEKLILVDLNFEKTKLTFIWNIKQIYCYSRMVRVFSFNSSFKCKFIEWMQKIKTQMYLVASISKISKETRVITNNFFFSIFSLSHPCFYIFKGKSTKLWKLFCFKKPVRFFFLHFKNSNNCRINFA